MGAPEQAAVNKADLPFERFIETLAQISNAKPLFSLFQGGISNIAHTVFAELMAQGISPAIVTTNFDTLFEQSFQERKLIVEKRWRDDELTSIDWSRTAPQLLKIHGCVEDLDSLAITIRRVANQRNIDTCHQLIRQVFGKAATPRVLVLGYSGSDHFDINPALQSISANRSEVMLISHVPNGGDSIEIFDLATASHAGPFRGFPGKLIHCDTKQMIEAIARRLGLAEFEKPVQLHSWEGYVTNWISTSQSEYGLEWSDLAAGFLLSAAYAPDLAIRRLTQAVKGNVTPLVRYRAYQKLSDNYRDSNQSLAAKDNVRLALKWASKIDNPEAVARCFLNWGVIRADEKEFRRAIRHYEHAATLISACSADEILLTCIGNKAIALKNLGGETNALEALDLHDQALALAVKIGDKRSEGRTYGNMGIVHSNLGNIEKAIHFYRQAKRIAIELGDKIHIAIWLANEGKDRLNSDRAHATALIFEAADLFESIGSPEFAITCRSWLDGFTS